MPIDPKTFEADLRALLDELAKLRSDSDSQRICWRTVAFILACYMAENGMEAIQIRQNPNPEYSELIERLRTAANEGRLTLGFSHDDITVCIEEPGGRFINPFRKG